MYLIPEEVDVVCDLSEVLDGVLLVLVEEVFGVGQRIFEHHIGAKPKTHLCINEGGNFSILIGPVS